MEPAADDKEVVIVAPHPVDIVVVLTSPGDARSETFVRSPTQKNISPHNGNRVILHF
jgi:hypothetical protein